MVGDRAHQEEYVLKKIVAIEHLKCLARKTAPREPKKVILFIYKEINPVDLQWAMIVIC